MALSFFMGFGCRAASAVDLDPFRRTPWAQDLALQYLEQPALASLARPDQQEPGLVERMRLALLRRPPLTKVRDDFFSLASRRKFGRGADCPRCGERSVRQFPISGGRAVSWFHKVQPGQVRQLPDLGRQGRKLVSLRSSEVRFVSFPISGGRAVSWFLPKVQRGQVRQLPDLGRQGRKLVSAKVQRGQVRQLPDLGRQGRKLVSLRSSEVRFVSFPISGGRAVSWFPQRYSEVRFVSFPISGGRAVSWFPKVQRGQVRQLPDLGRQGRKPVSPKGQRGQVRQLPDLGRQGRKLVSLKVQRSQVRQLPDLGRQGRKLVSHRASEVRFVSFPISGGRAVSWFPEGPASQVRQLPDLGRQFGQSHMARFNLSHGFGRLLRCV